MKGWVYVITNKAMPGLVKVGYSMKDPELRAAELNHTGSPHPYDVDYEVLVEEPYSVEQMAHGRLIDRREGKEWFRCSVEEAISEIKAIIQSKALVENFKRADREKVEAIRHRGDAEEKARYSAEVERKERLNFLYKNRQEITEYYDSRIKVLFPTIFSIFFDAFLFVAIAVGAIVGLFFPEFFKGGHKISDMFTIAFLIAWIVAIFIVKDYSEERTKKSKSYKTILAERETKLKEIENEINRLTAVQVGSD